MTTEEIQALIQMDWVESQAWNRLHHITLTDDQCAELLVDCWVRGPLRLTCGRTAAGVTIPGLLSRRGAPRCQVCCRITGLPPGVGSPKNDPACRAILNLP